MLHDPASASPEDVRKVLVEYEPVDSTIPTGLLPSFLDAGKPRQATPDGELLALAVELMIEIRKDVAELRQTIASERREAVDPPISIKETYTTEEVAERTGYRPWTIRHWCNKGRIRAVKVHGGDRTGE